MKNHGNRCWGAPPAMVDRLQVVIVKIVNDPATSKFLSEQGADPRTMTQAGYGAYPKAEVVKWARVVKDSGARVD